MSVGDCGERFAPKVNWPCTVDAHSATSKQHTILIMISLQWLLYALVCVRGVWVAVRLWTLWERSVRGINTWNWQSCRTRLNGTCLSGVREVELGTKLRYWRSSPPHSSRRRMERSKQLPSKCRSDVYSHYIMTLSKYWWSYVIVTNFSHTVCRNVAWPFFTPLHALERCAYHHSRHPVDWCHITMLAATSDNYWQLYERILACSLIKPICTHQTQNQQIHRPAKIAETQMLFSWGQRQKSKVASIAWAQFCKCIQDVWSTRSTSTLYKCWPVLK